MRITIIGTGYVGLVTGACLANYGHHVTCLDANGAKITDLQKGKTPFHEPGLEELVRLGLLSQELAFETILPENSLGPLTTTDTLIVAVGTPTDFLSGGTDIRPLYNAIMEAAPHLPNSCSILIKSTIPLGTTRDLSICLKNIHPDKSFKLLAQPEFLREGTAIEDFNNPARLIIGTQDDQDQIQALVHALYPPLIEKDVPLLITNYETAEIIKYASNGFLATKIAFINEMADLCEATGGSIQQVSQGMGLDPRIGKDFLEAGPGFGGSCFPKDLRALAHATHKFGVSGKIAKATLKSNIRRKESMSKLIIDTMGGDVQGKTITILGLTFKPNTDDMREAPSLIIIPALQEAGAIIQAYDPAGMIQARGSLRDIHYASDPYRAADGAHAIVVLTHWDEFRHLDYHRLFQTMTFPLMIDLRNVTVRVDAESAGFRVRSIGGALEGAQNNNEGDVLA